ncbi:PPE family protein [Mycobacterium kansasii 662]|uniref:PPE family protein n=1 Tax=Mycobacterium kansasii 662 TaxID=1299326 RepID=X7XN90_MYCKA|nr:PPE family protein [Mycobacterium kansasii 662]
MMAVATQYMAWLSAAATQAEQVAAQAAATATAFEAALAATVQPAVVAANRGLMQVLAATNWLGFNTPAIMDIEAAYEQMWAMDVVAMATYHADASAAASLLAPWQQVLRNLGIDIGKNGAINLASATPAAETSVSATPAAATWASATPAAATSAAATPATTTSAWQPGQQQPRHRQHRQS